MRHFISVGTLCLLAGVPLATQAAPNQSPCAQITATCEDAGFARGSARDGAGLLVDCINPLMQGVPQRKRASKPLPQVDPQLVADCKAANPRFGQPRSATAAPPAAQPAQPVPPPDAQPMPPPDAQPAPPPGAQPAAR